MMGLRKVLLATSVAAMATSPIPASAQVDGGIVLNILRECSKINDANARLACYDNNIRSAGGASAAAAGTASAPAAAGSFGLPQQNRNPSTNGQPSAPTPAQSQGAASASGFGGETLRSTRTETRAQRENGITATVSQVTEREPGTYLLTLDDGAQWVFAESVNRTYKVPERGSVISIDRASLGSFTMRYNSQAVVRVRRVR